eukprot:gene13348-13476_t
MSPTRWPTQYRRAFFGVIRAGLLGGEVDGHILWGVVECGVWDEKHVKNADRAGQPARALMAVFYPANKDIRQQIANGEVCLQHWLFVLDRSGLPNGAMYSCGTAFEKLTKRESKKQPGVFFTTRQFIKYFRVLCARPPSVGTAATLQQQLQQQFGPRAILEGGFPKRRAATQAGVRGNVLPSESLGWLLAVTASVSAGVSAMVSVLVCHSGQK